MLLEAPNQPGHLQWGVCDVEHGGCSAAERVQTRCSRLRVQTEWVQWTGPGADWRKAGAPSPVSGTVGGSDKGAATGTHKEGDSPPKRQFHRQGTTRPRALR